MATRPSTKRKRSSLPVSPPSGGRTVHSRGAQPEEEEQTLVEVDNEVPWALALKPQREAGQFIDITLSVGGRRIEAHRSILAGFSPYIKGRLLASTPPGCIEHERVAGPARHARARARSRRACLLAGLGPWETGTSTRTTST